MKKTRIIIISLIIVLCVIAVAVAIIFQMTENDYKKAANKEQSTADDIELIKNNFNNNIYCQAKSINKFTNEFIDRKINTE